MRFDFNGKTAAGIDISRERISIVLLKRGKNGPELVKSAVATMPAGAVEDGNIADAVMLCKAIRELKFHNRIWTSQAAVSLFAEPVVMQIMDMPKQAPSNIRQFVCSEVKNCVVLPNRDITLDFRAIGVKRRSADKRVLAVAAESAKIAELIGVCSRAGFNIEAVELPLLAYLRAVYGQRVAGKNKGNVLVVVLRGTTLTLCVLKNGEIDFIRNKEMGKNSANADDLNHWLADELSEVVRFYDIEAPENAGKWDITVFADSAGSPQVDSAQSSDAVEEYLKSKIQAEQLQVRTPQDAYTDTPVNILPAGKDKQPDSTKSADDSECGRENRAAAELSPVAIGLAMKLLMATPNDSRINLMPSQVLQTKQAKRDVLIAANAVAVILLIMLLAVNGLAFTIERTIRSTISKMALTAKQDTEIMVEQHELLDARLKAISSRLDRIEQISASHRDVSWMVILEDIRKATPRSVRISSIFSQDSSRVQIEGLAISNEDVNLFVNLLEKTQSIISVTLLDTRRQNEQSGVIAYQLICKLGIGSVKAKDVG
jgi:Tfp pilus assembly protein PilN